MKPTHPSHAFLRPPAWASSVMAPGPARVPIFDLGFPVASGAAFGPADGGAFRAKAAAHHQVSPAQIAVAPHGESLIYRVAQAILAPEARVALFEPAAPAFSRAILSAGARYIDPGRDFTFQPRGDAFTRLMDHGLDALFLASPGVPTGLAFPIDLIKEALRRGLWVVVDATWHGFGAPFPGAMLGDTGVERLIVIRDLGRPHGLGAHGAAYCWASPEVIARLWAMAPDARISAKATLKCAALMGRDADIAEQVLSRRADVHAAFEDAGCLCTDGQAAWVFARRLGVDGADFAAALRAEGLSVDGPGPETWRGAVRVGLFGVDDPAASVRAACKRLA